MANKKNGVPMVCPVKRCVFRTTKKRISQCPDHGVNLRKERKPRRCKGPNNMGHQKPRAAVMARRR